MKKIVYAVLIFSLLLAGCGAKAAPEEVKYYKTETIRTFFGASTSREVIEYDEEWKTTRITTYQDGAEISQVDYEYTETGLRMIGTQNGTEEILEYIITRDKQGNPLRTEQYLNGELYNSSECTYDTAGNLLTQASTIPAANMTVTLEMKYDENGRLIKTIQDSGYAVGTTAYTYDENGRLLTETYHTEAGSGSVIKEYSYSDDGLVQTALIYEADRSYSGKSVTTYDKAGNMLLAENYDADGNLTLSTACSYIGTDGTVSSGIESEE